MAWRAENKGLIEWISAKGGGLLNWFFWQNAAFRTDFWPKWRLPELDFDWYLGLGTEICQNKPGKLENVWFLVRIGSRGMEKCWKGSLVEQLR